MNSHHTQERVALVTGGARRIGAEIVRQLHAKGYTVFIHCQHSITQAQALSQELNQHRLHSAFVIQQDLGKAQAAERIMQQLKQHRSRLDVLVNNASVFIRTPQAICTEAQWNTLFEVNVKAPYCLSMVAYEFLAKHSGCIVNITDIHSQSPLKEYAVYCQTKAALEMQTKALAKEWGPQVRVNAVAPGAIAWPEADNGLSTEQQKQIIEKTPLKRHGEPGFIAQAVLALIENDFVTGHILKVDGGRSL